MNSETPGANLQELLAGFSRQRMLVIADLMVGEFLWGRFSRTSPEAPVPVVKVTSESYYPGGAANVARNLREFSPHVSVLGRVGTHRQGCQLLELLAASGIDTAGVQHDAGTQTIVKTRVIARNQQVV